MRPSWDVAVIGSGFGGSLLSLIARRLGRSVLLLEKGRHPRFVIGESSTPLADLLWLELTAKYDLPRLAPFAKWGTWRQEYPEIGCGLKRGFTFYHHTFGQPFRNAPDRSDQLIVAASPNERIADTHWYRPDFDHFLVREAAAAGVEYHDNCEVTSVGFDTNGAHLQAVHQGRPREFRARFVVDAGNHRGALVRSLGLQDIPLPHLPPTQALFTHFRHVDRLEDLPLHPDIDRAPYPVDDAAVHHVFDGGWIWVLRFVNGITSAGVAATDAAAARWRLRDGAAAWQRLLADLPTVGRQFARARAVEPWVHALRLAFRTTPAAGPGWALLPSAAGFVDPLLSSGFTLTLLGIERLAHALQTAWDQPAEFQALLQRHATDTADDVLALEHFIAAFYSRMGDFEAFTEIARLYFAAVIYCETARRLGGSANNGGFLLRRNPDFTTCAAACLDAALAGRNAAQLREGVDAILNDIDLAGLADASRRPWYPVLADDLRRARTRIGASAEQIETLLHRAGF